VASPFYTAAKPIPGQREIPIGTVHTCAACLSDYICDVRECNIERLTPAVGCPSCGQEGPHSKDNRNIECKHCYEFGCTKKHRVCRTCRGVDGEHYNCKTQKGYQFKLL